jgi:hypothetical protein
LTTLAASLDTLRAQRAALAVEAQAPELSAESARALMARAQRHGAVEAVAALLEHPCRQLWPLESPALALVLDDAALWLRAARR